VAEESLLAQWDATFARQLRHAHLQYLEHLHHPAEPPPEDIAAALAALSIPSPTQITVDICRKHHKSGTFKSVSSADIKAATARLRAKNKKKP
jgi:hypothetical protein